MERRGVWQSESEGERRLGECEWRWSTLTIEMVERPMAGLQTNGRDYGLSEHICRR